MTYLRAPPEEWTPYLSRALRPLRPVCLAGVSAKTWEGEWKQPQVACMQWWKVTAVALRVTSNLPWPPRRSRKLFWIILKSRLTTYLHVELVMKEHKVGRSVCMFGPM